MQPNEYQDFLKVLSTTHIMYNQKFSDLIGEIWINALKNFALKEIKAAFSKHVVNTENGQFMPKIADIVRLIEGSAQSLALQAWTKVDSAVRSIGIYQSAVFDDALIHVVIQEMGGWIRLGERKESEWDFVRNEFVNRYKGYQYRHEVPLYFQKLIGIFESHNRMNGLNNASLILIGDADKCKNIFFNGNACGAMTLKKSEYFSHQVAERVFSLKNESNAN